MTKGSVRSANGRPHSTTGGRPPGRPAHADPSTTGGQMTTGTTATTPTGPAPLRRPQWVRVLLVMLRALLVQSLWFWVWVLVPAAVAIVLLDRFGDLDMSVVQFARYGGIWYPFALSFIGVGIQFTVHVANGLTRRSYIRAVLVTTLLIGLAYAVLMTAAMVVERAVYTANGWAPYTSGHSASLVAGAGSLFAATALAFTAGGVSGLLVGIAFYRGGALRGFLALPLTVSPAVVVMLLTDDVAAGRDWTFPATVSTVPLTAALCLALIAAAATAFHLLARSAPVSKGLATS
ncbi:hypothetical protein CLV63_103104 [Murinocardiopsis flavida]|uniref:Uncharacterized protein n=1 Tax=Murinocardiopsis flavida TaxID=645275 RepID=A0A2P8DQA5_9ACTN|nr:hypothetical protein [Murinocardiopsis flavida]PSK99381.1 hypothetical protein CLV63_103104 [Murinocardiopsis flavida]